MEYVKCQGNFYKKINLKDLDKKELIKLIQEAVEVDPYGVIERWNTLPVYIEKIVPTLPQYPTPIVWCSSNLNNLSTGELQNLAVMC